MKKSLVLLITGLHYGGMERVAFIAYYLLKDIYDVQVVSLYAKDADYKPDFNVLDLNCPPKKYKISKMLNVINRISAVKKIKKLLNPDIVMSFGTSANFANVVSKRKEKVVVGIRSYDWLTDYFATLSIDKWIYNRADMVVSVSKVIAEDAERIFDIEKSKSRVLYNPYDVEYICKRAKEEITEINIPNNKKIIISVGRLVNQKGYNHLIKAFSQVLIEFPDAMLIIVGHGEKECILKNLISDLGIGDNVLLLGGQENPFKFMKISSMYVLSSITEGFPNAMVEAMAIGLPVLAVDCKSGPREILSLSESNNKIQDIERCEYGIISREVSGSLDYSAQIIEDCDYALASGMKLLFQNSDLREYYSKKSYDRVQEFTFEKFKEQLVSIFDCL